MLKKIFRKAKEKGNHGEGKNDTSQIIKVELNASGNPANSASTPGFASAKRCESGAFDLDRLSNWLKEKEAQFLSKHNLQQELNDYVLQIKKIARRVNGRINQWIDNIDLSKLKITSVGEINSLFSDAQTLAKLLNTQKEITLRNVSLFNKLLQEKTFLVEQRIENSALREELVHISRQEQRKLSENASYYADCTNNYADYTETPLWKDLQEINVLREEFEYKIKNNAWDKMLHLRQNYVSLLKSLKSIEELTLRVNTNKEHLKNVLFSLAEKEKEFSLLKTRPEFVSVEERESTIQDISPEMDALRQRVALFFSPLKPIFESYLKVVPDNSLVYDYIRNYPAAFCEDEDLAVMSIIRKLWIAVDENKLELDDKDRAVLAERAEQTNSGELRELHKQYYYLKRKLEEMEHSGDRALIMKLDDLNYRLEHFRGEEKRLRFVIKQLEEEVSSNRAAIQSYSRNIVQQAKDNFGEEIKVEI